MYYDNFNPLSCPPPLSKKKKYTVQYVRFKKKKNVSQEIGQTTLTLTTNMSNDDQNINDTQSSVSGMTFWIVAIVLFIMSTVAIALQFIIEGPEGPAGPAGSPGSDASENSDSDNTADTVEATSGVTIVSDTEMGFSEDVDNIRCFTILKDGLGAQRPSSFGNWTLTNPWWDNVQKGIYIWHDNGDNIPEQGTHFRRGDLIRFDEGVNIENLTMQILRVRTVQAKRDDENNELIHPQYIAMEFVDVGTELWFDVAGAMNERRRFSRIRFFGPNDGDN